MPEIQSRTQIFFIQTVCAKIISLKKMNKSYLRQKKTKRRNGCTSWSDMGSIKVLNLVTMEWNGAK